MGLFNLNHGVVILTHINTDVLNELRDILADDFIMFINTFIDDTKVRLVALDTALAVKDIEQLRQESHSLKGSSSNLGLIDFSESCYILEKQSYEGVFDGADQLVVDIKDKALIIIEELEKLTAH